ncbi:MAG: T9SS type A sorting domain-containing protein [Elusimicrobia bacterium]|nr:T9SS type A sorting domain-containing protein [Elusimicrobiota bacterium]
MQKIRKTIIVSSAFAFCILFSVTSEVFAGKYIITTFYGDGTNLNAPRGVAIDSANNYIYVADTGNNQIKKISSAGSLLQTIGSGTAGYTNGTTSTAQFNFPVGLVVDPIYYYVYVADMNNHCIRWTDGATVNLLAGTTNAGYVNATSTTSQFSSPFGLTIDSLGNNLYVADMNNNVIRKLDGTNVTTFAGGGTDSTNSNIPATTAQLGTPRGITMDSNYVYFSESDATYNRIRKIKISDNTIWTVATGFTEPRGIAVDTSGNIYLAEANNHTIKKIDTSNNVTIIAGTNGSASFWGDNGDATAAYLNSPHGVAVSTVTGVVYIADTTNNRIRKLTWNNSPTLTWTGEANYISDGLNPESATASSSFVYRVKYTDVENDAPASGYPKLHILKGGTEVTQVGSPLSMWEVDSYDTIYTDGKLYTYTVSLSSVGTNYTYYFEANDVYNSSATGTAAIPTNGPVVGSAPTLEWAGSSGYESDGVDPDTGTSTTTFTYKVKYKDSDNDAPNSGYPKLHILKDGSELSISPITMISDGTADYVSGVVYSTSVVGLTAGSNSNSYTYYFEAQDAGGTAASGTPTGSKNGPTAAALPDLYVVDMNGVPTICNTGQTFTLNYHLGNQGNVTISTNILVGYYLSTRNTDIGTSWDANIDFNQVIDTVTINLPASWTMPKTVNFPVSSSVPSGTYYLRIILDVDDKIVESDEANNTKYWGSSMQITNVGSGGGGNPLDNAYCYPSPAKLSQGDTIKFAQFTSNATLKILSSAGQVIKELKADSNGVIQPWNGQTDDGAKLGSGVYVVHAKDNNGNKKIFKILVIK